MRAFRNIYVVSLITKVNIVILTFISSILINRFLGPELKGQYAYVINFVNIVSLIMTLSITRAIPYFTKKFGDAIYKQFINFVYLQTLLFVIIAIIINQFVLNNQLLLILIFSIISQFNQQVGYIAMIKNINLKNILSLVDLFIYVAILALIFFIGSEEKLKTVYYLYAAKSILSCILYVFAYKMYPNKSGINLKKFKRIIAFSIFPTITALLITFNYKIDIIILERFSSFSQVGLYSLAVNLASMLWFIPDAFKDVLFHKTAKSDSISDIKFSIKINTYIGFVIILVFLFIGRSFISIVYGDAFIGSNDVAILLFIGNIPIIFFKMINTLYISKGRQKKATVILIIAVILNVIANLILIPYYGIFGAAIASVISYLICGFAFLLSFKKEYNLTLKEIFILDEVEISKIKDLFRRRVK